MGSDYYEIIPESGRYPYKPSEICFCLSEYAKKYIKENREKIKNIDRKITEAVIVNFINYLGMVGWCDFALYTKSLHDETYKGKLVDSNTLISILLNYGGIYLYNNDFVTSILDNKHMSEITNPFEPYLGEIVLLDFINYVTKQNGYKNVFTIDTLMTRAKVQKDLIETHDTQRELSKLKTFLINSGNYYRILSKTHSINEAYEDINDIGEILEPTLDSRFYELAYAYAKLNREKEEDEEIPEPIQEKLLEMKVR